MTVLISHITSYFMTSYVAGLACVQLAMQYGVQHAAAWTAGLLSLCDIAAELDPQNPSCNTYQTQTDVHLLMTN